MQGIPVGSQPLFIVYGWKTIRPVKTQKGVHLKCSVPMFREQNSLSHAVSPGIRRLILSPCLSQVIVRRVRQGRDRDYASCQKFFFLKKPLKCSAPCSANRILHRERNLAFSRCHATVKSLGSSSRVRPLPVCACRYGQSKTTRSLGPGCVRELWSWICQRAVQLLSGKKSWVRVRLLNPRLSPTWFLPIILLFFLTNIFLF